MLLKQAVTANSLKLGTFAVLTAGILAYTNLSTKDRIAEQIRIAKEKALLEIVPEERHDNEMLDDIFTLSSTLAKKLNLKEETNAFIAKYKNKPQTIIFPGVAPEGYSGPISVIVGINLDGTVAGVRVTDHKETPGLGDGITLKKSNWILDFNGKSLQSPPPEKWRVKKDHGVFDQFTGATITPRAVVKQVKNTLEFFEQHKSDIFPEQFPAPVAETTTEEQSDDN